MNVLIFPNMRHLKDQMRVSLFVFILSASFTPCPEAVKPLFHLLAPPLQAVRSGEHTASLMGVD